ncbi:MAG: 2-dehydro-3-deoxygalactonokinase [Pseudomonadota bacterium]
MSEPAFIAGDWGTSRLRLYLCDASGHVLARAEAEGAAVPDHAARFAAAVAGWDKAHGKLPALLGGMVGSTVGWKEVPYLSCPARPEALAAAALRFEHEGRVFAIIPGLKCVNRTGAPDVMRGEEVQILGALNLHPQLARGRHIFCMPGTHAKWVAVDDGAVTEFQTAPSGEVFELLRKHSVLARDGGEVRADSHAFTQGLDFFRRNAQADLLHLLFSTRARVVTGEMPKADGASYLSGLVLGADVDTAVSLLGLIPADTVYLICTPALAELYDKALAQYGLKTETLDGDACALAGLVRIHTEVFS